MDLAVILKIVERCNLDCQYCYMYRGQDQSWRFRPARISDADLDTLLSRLTEFLATNPKNTLTLELHGGEPLLFGKKRLSDLLSRIRRATDASQLHIALQTNATLLDEEWLNIFQRYNVHFSVSCDGPPEIHDLFRIFHNGNPSGKLVEDALRLCLSARNSELFGGVLLVANPNASGARLVRYFYDLGIRWLDLLLPDGNYATPPSHLTAYNHADMLRFMVEAFDEWIRIADPHLKIRTFEEIIVSIFGRRSSLDMFGGDLSSLVVIESDGSYQFLDVLRICGENAVRTDLSIHTHSLQEYFTESSSAFPQPCIRCRTCPAFRECGGGYLPHRFDGMSYDNPSFYCFVLYELWKHIKAHVISVTPSQMWLSQH